MVVGIVALIVIGPKDLPQVFRTMGEFTGKARGMAREFTRAMNDAANDSGMNDISKGLKAATNPKAFGIDKIKEATGFTANQPPLSPERAEAKAKMDAGMAKAAEARKARDAARDASVTPPAPPPTPVKTQATSKPKAPVPAKSPAAPKAKTPPKPKGDA